MVAENRQQHLVAQPLLVRGPLHVEVVREFAGRAVLEHVPPPRIGGSDGHMVRDNVEQLSEAEISSAGAETLVSLGPAELLADAAVIDHVIAVVAPRRSLKYWREIQMANAELRQVVA